MGAEGLYAGPLGDALFHRPLNSVIIVGIIRNILKFRLCLDRRKDRLYADLAVRHDKGVDIIRFLGNGNGITVTIPDRQGCQLITILRFDRDRHGVAPGRAAVLNRHRSILHRQSC